MSDNKPGFEELELYRLGIRAFLSGKTRPFALSAFNQRMLYLWQDGWIAAYEWVWGRVPSIDTRDWPVLQGHRKRMLKDCDVVK